MLSTPRGRKTIKFYARNAEDAETESTLTLEVENAFQGTNWTQRQDKYTCSHVYAKYSVDLTEKQQQLYAGDTQDNTAAINPFPFVFRASQSGVWNSHSHL